MSNAAYRLIRLHDAFFAAVERACADWAPGLLARFAFAATLLVYFWNAALTKIGEGALGFLSISDAAYFQILPPVIETYGYDASAVPVLPWGVIVAAGTYAEFVLPALIVLGLATRLAALGMIVFVLVQSYVDIAFHGVDARTVGALFDRFPDAAILDQRLLWVAVLAPLAIRGGGALSLDALLARRRAAGRGLSPA